jgi:hypothetical protein
MARTTTKGIDPRKLVGRHGIATVVQLMMACNDLWRANEAASLSKGEVPPWRKDQQLGKHMYFIRVQFLACMKL